MDGKRVAGAVLILAFLLTIGLLGVPGTRGRPVSSELLGDSVHDGRVTWSESHKASVTVDGDEYSVDYTVLLRYDTNWKTGQKSTTELEVRIDDTSHDTASLSLSGHVEFELATDSAVAWMWITPYLEKGESWNSSRALAYTATSARIKPGETTNGTIWLVLGEYVRVTDTGKITGGTGQRLKASPGIVLRSPPQIFGMTLTSWMFISLIAVAVLLLAAIVALIILYRSRKRKEDISSKATTPPT